MTCDVSRIAHDTLTDLREMLRLEEEERDRHELLLAQELGLQLDFEEGAADAASAAAADAHHPSQPKRVA